MEKIQHYLKVLHHLSNAETFTYHKSILDRLLQKIMGLLRAKPQYDKCLLAFNNYDGSFKFPLEAPETLQIKLLDKQRRGVFIQVDHAVRDAAKYSVIPEAKAAAEALLPIFKNFAGTPDEEYEAEMANLINMIQELEKPENAARIAVLGQTANVAALKQINLDFQAVYTTRFEGKYAHKQEGTSTRLRGKLTEEFDVFCQILTGLRLSAVDQAEIDLLEEIIAIINSTTDQFATIVNRHLGIKKTDSGKKDEETQAPDTQEPDTSPTPAPDTPPQNPSDEPHHLDPNEHPPAGE